MGNFFSRTLLGILLVLLAACEQPPTVKPEYPNIIQSSGSLFILNEGNFQSGNASIDYISFTDQVYHSNAFETKNGRALGDVLQSITRWGSKGYLVVNNSAKVEVVNLKDLSSVATITGFKSPRYMCIQNDSRAYVSEYYGGGVKVVDLTTNSIVSTIPIAANCDELLLFNNKLYVTAANKRYLYIINTQSNTLMDSIELAFGPNSLCLDKMSMLWVLSSGNPVQSAFENGALQQIDPFVDTIVKKFTITPQSEHGAIKLRINAQLDKLYWINKGIYKQEVTATDANAVPWIPNINGSYWALRCDSLTNEVYVGNALDFNQRSEINRYDEQANLKGTFKGGIITTDFYFWY